MDVYMSVIVSYDCMRFWLDTLVGPNQSVPWISCGLVVWSAQVLLVSSLCVIVFVFVRLILAGFSSVCVCLSYQYCFPMQMCVGVCVCVCVLPV